MSVSSDIILQMSARAKEAITNGKDITNGTIGMMFSNEGALPVSPTVRSVMANHLKDDDLSYSTVPGTRSYCEGLIKWFLGENFLHLLQQGVVRSMATVGGTGAVATSFHSVATAYRSAAVVIPKLAWPNYVTQAAALNMDAVFYDNLSGSTDGVPSIEGSLSQALSNHEHALLVINDPCQNPTGYCMSAEDWAALVDALNRLAGRVSLLIDAAYIDFSTLPSKKIISDSLMKLAEPICAYLCFSFSKTFSFYGLRAGGLVVFCQNNDVARAAYQRCCNAARCFWSVPNHMAMNVISELIENPESFALLQKEIGDIRKTVENRSKRFLAEAKRVGLEHYRYVSGFFISIPCHDAVLTSQALMGQDIYLAPVSETVLRVAICCVPDRKIDGLATAIKNSLK